MAVLFMIMDKDQTVASKKPEYDNANGNEELHRMVLKNALDALIVCDEKANYIYTSPSMERLFGYKQDELIGRNAFELFHPEDVSINKERLEMLLEGKEFPSIEFRFRKKSGDYVWCDIAVKLVQTAQGDHDRRDHQAPDGGNGLQAGPHPRHREDAARPREEARPAG